MTEQQRSIVALRHAVSKPMPRVSKPKRWTPSTKLIKSLERKAQELRWLLGEPAYDDR